MKSGIGRKPVQCQKGVDEFNISLKEMTEIEKDGRAQMVRTRFELKSVIDEIKNFTGSKEQEKAKVEELNRKYGESFGYYKTLSEWYDTLIQRARTMYRFCCTRPMSRTL